MKCSVPARPACQPRLDLRVTVGCVVVDPAVDVKLARHRRVGLGRETLVEGAAGATKQPITV